MQQAQELLALCASAAKDKETLRIGISGVPGAGKSTLIEQLGLQLLTQNNHSKLAVIAIDPSSQISGGSILGDKTRMTDLSNHPRAFIRPTPAGSALGGVARRTRETIQLFEAAGFNYIVVETVGVGQSEATVQSMTDLFILLQIAGAGDDLQGIKRGVLELCDLLIVNKADGQNLKNAQETCAMYQAALHVFAQKPNGWIAKAMTCSALNNQGITQLIDILNSYALYTKQNGSFQQKRTEQLQAWFKAMLEELALKQFFQHPQIAQLYPQFQQQVAERKDSVANLVHQLWTKYK